MNKFMRLDSLGFIVTLISVSFIVIISMIIINNNNELEYESTYDSYEYNSEDYNNDYSSSYNSTDDYDYAESDYTSNSMYGTSNDGYEWVELTYSEKYDKISEILSNIKNNGFTVLESESFFIDALDAFYSDSSDDYIMSTSINESIIMTSAMSGAIVE